MCTQIEGDPVALFRRIQELKSRMHDELLDHEGEVVTLTLHPAATIVQSEFRYGSRWGQAGMRGSKHRTDEKKITGVLQGAEMVGALVDIEIESQGVIYCILLEHITQIHMKPRVLAVS